MFLLGTAEVFADNTSSTLMPMLVHRDDLALANARLTAGFITVNQLAGPPIGAALFAVGSAAPFASQAVLVALGALLALRIALPPHGRDGDRGGPACATTSPRRCAGCATTLRCAPWSLTIFVFNITFGAAWSVLVLYATERLGLSEVGFGLLTTVSAVGGLVGTLAYGWITRRVSLGNIMRIGLLFETFTMLALALATRPWVAMCIFFGFGAHAFIWGTTSLTIRQRAVPTELQGRVGSVNLLGVYGGLVVGAGIGAVLAQHWGVTAPFWFAFVGSSVFVVLIWAPADPHRARGRTPGCRASGAGPGIVSRAELPPPAAIMARLRQ